MTGKGKRKVYTVEDLTTAVIHAERVLRETEANGENPAAVFASVVGCELRFAKGRYQMRHCAAEASSTWSGAGLLRNWLWAARKELAFLEAVESLDRRKNLFDTPKPVPKEPTFQERVAPWMLECFGEEVANNQAERNHRFLEEALELVQSCGTTRAEAIQLVDYVFSRDVGDPDQEVGGVLVTLAALCLARCMDMHQCGEIELSRVWLNIVEIREKQASKPKHSPLPQGKPTNEIGTVWRHRKGGLYEIVGICQIEATNEPAFLYQPLNANGNTVLWVAPVAEFLAAGFVLEDR